ncbi:MAG: hypothetical protein KDB00_14865, partial [Planctomycetales bacterium]|nr:hypothetical protein [Planctomycetales bacterium]
MRWIKKCRFRDSNRPANSARDRNRLKKRSALFESLEERRVLASEVLAEFVPIQPLGSFAYRSITDGSLNASETDSFPLDVSDTQILTAILRPLDGSLGSTVSVVGPDLSVIDSIAGSAGESIVLHTARLDSAGSYRIEVSGDTGSGDYELQVFLNADTESELSGTGGLNNNPGQAEQLSSESALQFATNARRMAVHGSVGSGPLLFDPLYSVSEFTDQLLKLSPYVMGISSSTTIQLPGRTVTGAKGLAIDSSTGEYWTLLRLSGQESDELVRINVVTGDATDVGDTGKVLSDLGFDEDGNLFAVSDGSQDDSSTLYQLDTSIGVATSFMTLPETTSDKAIAFNPDDGLMYVTSGSFPIVMQAVNLTNKTVLRTDIPGTALPDALGSIESLSYVGEDHFILSDGSIAYWLTTSGEVMPFGVFPVISSGVTLDSSTIQSQSDIADVFELTLDANTPVSFVVGDLNNVAEVGLKLYDDTGTIVAVGRTSPQTAASISGFVPANDGTYFAEISVNGPPVEYILQVAVNASLDVEPNDELVVNPSAVPTSGGNFGESEFAGPPWQNPLRKSDVDNNGAVTIRDALLVLNQLGLSGGAVDLKTAVAQRTFRYHYDTSGDGRITTLDALYVINEIARSLNGFSTDTESIPLTFADRNRSNGTLSRPIDLTANGVAIGHLGHSPSILQSDDQVDYYQINVNIGDELVFDVSPPFSDNLVVNYLQPYAELYDETGALVADAFDLTNSGTLSLSYTATSTGRYTFGVFSQFTESGITTGDYVLQASGATGDALPFEVTLSSIAENSIIAQSQNELQINFSGDLYLSSVEISDFKIDGTVVPQFIVVDGDTLLINLGATLADGAHTFSIGGNAVTSVAGIGIDSYTLQFNVDAIAPRVIESSIGQGDAFNVGDLTFVAKFDEEISSFFFEDAFQLFGSANGSVAADSYSYDPSTSQLTIHYSNLQDDIYHLTLNVGGQSLRDLAGNPLDGEPVAFPIPPNRSGDGVPGGSFVVRFSVDSVDPIVYPTLQPIGPVGGLVYDPTIEGSISTSGDIDQYQLSLDGGQTATIIVESGNGLKTNAQLMNDSSTVISSASANQANETIRIQTFVLVGDGNYTLELAGLDGTTGSYSIRVIVNAAIEDESLGLGANNATTFAQDIGPSFISLGGGVASRGAVVGSTQPSIANQQGFTDDDYFKFTLLAGQSSSFALTSQPNKILNLDILDTNGNLLATAFDIGNGPAIDDLLAPASGTYYARVRGDSGIDYTLVVTRDTSLERRLPGTVQTIGSSGNVLGAIRLGEAGEYTISIGVASDNGNEQQIIDQLNDSSKYLFDATAIDLAGITLATDLDIFDVVIIGGEGARDSIAGYAPLLRSWVEDGGHLIALGGTIFSAGTGFTFGNGTTNAADIDAIVPVNTSANYGIDYIDNDYSNPNHPITQGVDPFFSNWEFPADDVTNPWGEVLATVSGHPAVVAGGIGFGESAYIGANYYQSFLGLNSGSADRLLEQTVAWASRLGRDDYLFTADAGSTLTITTSTPGGGPGMPTNDLVPSLFLFYEDDDPFAVVASDTRGATDGRNANLQYTIPAGVSGTYRIAVEGFSSFGDYSLNIEGASTSTAPLETIFAVPSDASRFRVQLDTFTIGFDHEVLLSTVDADDVRINNQPTSGFTVIDGRHIAFDISTIATGTGTYNLVMDAGAIAGVGGQLSQSLNITFSIDTKGPQVISTFPVESGIVEQGEVRDFLLQDSATNSVLRYDGITGTLLGPFVASGSGGLSGPHNPTFGPDGNLYVISGNSRQVLRYDGRNGQFIDIFVDSANGFSGSSELAFDASGNLYAATTTGVFRYDSQGNFIDIIAGPAQGVGQACGVELGTDGLLYVLDTQGAERILRFDPVTGQLVDVFVDASGGIVNACDFDFGPNGDLFVTNLNARTVRRFSGQDGSFVSVFANTGPFPSGITLGPDNHFYVNAAGTTEEYDGQTGAFLGLFANNGGFGNFFPGPPSTTSITITFDEELNTLGLDAGDILVVDSAGTAFPVDTFNYDPSTSLATIDFFNLPEGDYTLTLVSGFDGFRDTVDNLLDGSPSFPLPSGDGVQGGDFMLHFTVEAPNLTPLTWDGGGDGVSWNDPLNWSEDILPDATRNVVIDDATKELTVQINSDAVARTITTVENLSLANAKLTTRSIEVNDLIVGIGSTLTAATGFNLDVTVNGDFDLQTGALPLNVSGAMTVAGATQLASGTTLSASGIQASITATGAAVIDGANLSAIDGGQIQIPNVTTYTHDVTSGGQVRTIGADGPGSQIELSGITTITVGRDFANQLNIQATNGGVIDLANVTQVLVNKVGNPNLRRLEMLVDGAGSLINMPSLANFTDEFGGTTNSVNRFSTITVRNGGELNASQLSSISGVWVTLDGTGTMSVSGIQEMTNSQLMLSGAGGNYDFDAVTNLNGSNVLVSGGATVTFPALANYINDTLGITNQTRTFSVTGSGSQLLMPALATIDGGAL